MAEFFFGHQNTCQSIESGCGYNVLNRYGKRGTRDFSNQASSDLTTFKLTNCRIPQSLQIIVFFFASFVLFHYLHFDLFLSANLHLKKGVCEQVPLPQLPPLLSAAIIVQSYEIVPKRSIPKYHTCSPEFHCRDDFHSGIHNVTALVIAFEYLLCTF